MTDTSLQAERDKTDNELATKSAAIEARTDATVAGVRVEVDGAVQGIRDRLDTEAAAQPVSPAPILAKERSAADNALQAERMDSDESVKREREARDRAMASLLRLEREDTDENLVIERGAADDALSGRDAFLEVVAHDLRSMLGGIALSTESIVKDFPDSSVTEFPSVEDEKRRIDRQALTIRRLVGRMNRLIGDLTDIASIEAGRLRIVRTHCDLNELNKEALERFDLPAVERGIKLMSDLPGQTLTARVDRDRILEVIGNVITNALKFTPKGGRITLGLEALDGEARISIADTGSGIPPEQLNTIFDRFAQGSRRDRRGFGLGLYISRNIVESHGGRIWVESVVGAGSTFHFTVPFDADSNPVLRSKT